MKANFKTTLMAMVAMCASATTAMAQNITDPKTWAWDFPQGLSIKAEAGQEALTCQMHYFELVKEGEGLLKKTMIWYDTTIAEPGAEKTAIDNYGTRIEVPNALIIPLDKNGKAKKGDILLTHDRYHSLTRAIVIDAANPAEPVVCFLDDSWPDKPDSDKIAEKQKGEQLKAGSFNVLKKDTFMSGAQVAFGTGENKKFGKIMQVSGDKLLVSVFADRLECVSKSECTLLPLTPKIKVGDTVSCISSDEYEPGYKVVKVDLEHGHVWVQYEGSSYTHCYGLFDVMK
ncbi:MAG: hypothetical protein J6Y38_01030 [Bacteroidaceae bacterium]|nr:hypothetical protein [Bacteroidaceae bacterium]